MAKSWYRDFFAGLALESWRRATTPEVTATEADYLWRQLKLVPGQAVLDVACGEGRLALPLARRGCAVTGVDVSPALLATARASAKAERLRIAWRRGDLRALARVLSRRGTGAPPRFDAALLWGNSLGYLPRAETATALAALGAALKPGGRLAIDTCMVADSILPNLDERTWLRLDDLLVLLEHDYDPAAARLDTVYTFALGAKREERRATHWIFTLGELRDMLAAARLRVRSLHTDLAGTPYAFGALRLLLIAQRDAD